MDSISSILDFLFYLFHKIFQIPKRRLTVNKMSFIQ